MVADFTSIHLARFVALSIYISPILSHCRYLARCVALSPTSKQTIYRQCDKTGEMSEINHHTIANSTAGLHINWIRE